TIRPRRYSVCVAGGPNLPVFSRIALRGEEETVLKFPTLGAAFAVAALAAAPANAQVKIRLGAETQLLDHVNNPPAGASSTTWLTDRWRPSLVGMLGFYVLPVLSIDGEIAEAFQTNPSERLGTTFRDRKSVV